MLFLFLISLAQSSLLAVVEICRHGARSPTTFQPWDNYTTYPQGPGELLPGGMRQQYLVGLELRNRYIVGQGLLSPFYYQPQIFVYADDVNRTIMSAQSQIQGLYPAGVGPVVRSASMNQVAVPPLNTTNLENTTITGLGMNALPYLTQVVPIHSDNQTRQIALDTANACPYYNNLTNYKLTLPGIQEIYSQFSDVISTIVTTMNVSQSYAQKNVRKIADSLVSNNFLGYPLPLGFNNTFFQRVQLMADTIKAYTLFEPDLLARFAGTSLLNLVVNNLQSVINQATYKKFFLYSAHDTTISSCLAFLQLDFSRLPPFASTLIFELWQFGNSYYVNVRYNDVIQTLPTCGSANCTWNAFQRYISFRSVPNFNQVCNYQMKEINWTQQNLTLNYDFELPGDSDDDFKWYFWTSLVIFVAVLFVILISVKNLQRSAKIEGNPRLQESMNSLRSS